MAITSGFEHILLNINKNSNFSVTNFSPSPLCIQSQILTSVLWTTESIAYCITGVSSIEIVFNSEYHREKNKMLGYNNVFNYLIKEKQTKLHQLIKMDLYIYVLNMPRFLKKYSNTRVRKFQSVVLKAFIKN